MNFDSFSEFLAMGDHGFYVWLSYGATLVVVLANIAVVAAARKRFFAQMRQIERRNQTALSSAIADRASGNG